MSHMLLKGWHRYKEKGKYSWSSSLVIAFVATVLLWWLPIFGPMVAGYVSGRTAGSKYKGVVITALVAAIIGAVSILFTYFIAVPASVNYYLSATILSHVQSVSPYGAWFVSSIGRMFTSFPFYVVSIPPTWAVLIGFGFVGGAMSELLVKGNGRKSIISSRHQIHDEAKALTPRQVEYAPPVDSHPLLKRIVREREPQESSEDYI